MSKVTTHTLRAKKQNGEKFAVITAYDACFARLVEQAGIDVILVGDSLGMVLQGQDSTVPVTVDDMAYHTACVKRATSDTLIIADMPFGSYNTADAAMTNASELMQAGAHMVKVEGGDWLLETVTMLTQRGIPVCAHLGLTPQSVNILGGYKVQGRAAEQAQAMIRDAKAMEAAGADLLVLECVPTELAGEISQQLGIPVIGIGAGPKTDAQVLVLHDMLGISPRLPKFVRNFAEGSVNIQDALNNYKVAVESGEFPAPEHCFD